MYFWQNDVAVPVVVNLVFEVVEEEEEELSRNDRLWCTGSVR